MAAAAKQALTLEQIQQVEDVPGRVWVEVPEWGKNAGVWIRGLTRGEVRRINDTSDEADADAFAISSAMVDPAMSVDDAKALDKKGLAATNRIMNAIKDASGLTPGFRSGAAG
jgi:hypothetical protein